MRGPEACCKYTTLFNWRDLYLDVWLLTPKQELGLLGEGEIGIATHKKELCSLLLRLWVTGLCSMGKFCLPCGHHWLSSCLSEV